jgi:precorrin-2 dehydrogenase/sirohydrochlorin ferrochelatase
VRLGPERGKIVKYYPVFWDIKDKKCVVVGGGEVAARKVKRLLACGADVSVVSPQLSPEFISLKAEKALEHIAADYDIKYIAGAALIIGATDDEKINAAICADARSLGIPVNIVDDPQKCDFILPSIVERGDLAIAVGTGGNSPALARYLREELESRYGAEYEFLLNILSQLRPQMKKAGKGKVWFDSLITAGILDLIKEEEWDEVKRKVKEITGEEVAID